jgi:hypothetical protein
MTPNQTMTALAALAAIDGPPLPVGARPACVEQPDTFFPRIGKGGDYTAPRRAKALCHTCPWRAECFAWAADPANQVKHGIWGGYSFSRGSNDETHIAEYRATHHPKKETA